MLLWSVQRLRPTVPLFSLLIFLRVSYVCVMSPFAPQAYHVDERRLHRPVSGHAGFRRMAAEPAGAGVHVRDGRAHRVSILFPMSTEPWNKTKST